MAAVWAPGAFASFGVSLWDAGTCATDVEPAAQCTKATPDRGYTQAAGHPNVGFTEFRFNTAALGLPDGQVKDVRVDLPKGLAINPQATPQCTQAQLEAAACLPTSQVGTDYATLVNLGLPAGATPLAVYNIVPQPGEPARFGMTVPVVNEQIYLEGGIAWDTDYHEYFTIHVSDTVPLAGTRLVFDGRAGDGTFITLPSRCSAGPQDFPVTTLNVTSYAGESVGPLMAQTPRGVDTCGAVPFHPTISVTPDSTASDQATGVTVDVRLPQNPDGAGSPNTSTLRTARVTLPDGLTINPAAATGLEACTDAQLGEGTTRAVACPAASRVGSVAMEAPALPPGSLNGSVYIGQPLSSDPASGQEYRIFLAADSARYGVSVRLTGNVSADPQTGQLTATFTDNPDVPLSRFTLHFDGGPRSALATPLACGTATTTSVLAPWSGNADATPTSAFAVDGCPAPGAFTPALAAPTSSTAAGGATTFTADVRREAGQEALSRIALDLPPGLMGYVSRVERCGDAAAATGDCPESSRIGTTTVAAGSGPEPFTLGGNVYLTGPYGGAPFGLSIVVHAIAGPFDLGVVVVRAGVFVDRRDAHLQVVSDPLPTVVGGVPLRLRDVQVTIDRSAFLYNPTSCDAMTVSGTVASTAGTSASVSSPFQATGCASLPFKPVFTAKTRGKLTFKHGAALDVHIGMPAGSANIRSISVRLPKELPSRLIPTINNGCLIEQFEADYTMCPKDSYVGTVKAVSPVVSQPLTGPAYIVAVPGDVPRLELKLFGHGEAEGVEVDLEGMIVVDSGGGRTKATFSTVPDVPISSFDVHLPTGPHSALDAPSNDLCKGPIKLDLSIVAQSGATQDSTKTIAVAKCPKIAKVKIVRATPSRAGVRLRILAPAAGRMTVRGRGLRTVVRKVNRKLTYSVALRLTKQGKRTVARRGSLKTPVSVRFKPTNAPRSSTAKTKTLRIGHRRRRA